MSTKEDLTGSLGLLGEMLPSLTPWEKGFYSDMCAKSKKIGFIPSVKQSALVTKLIHKYSRPSGSDFASIEADTGVPGMENLVARMQAMVSPTNPYPRLTLDALGEQTIQLSVAGKTAKKPGSINVTDGLPYGNNIWFGRVTVNGEWHARAMAPAWIADLLSELSSDFQTTVAVLGQLSGSCQFCRKKLTHEGSLQAGYGPVCASKWGLDSPYTTEA